MTEDILDRLQAVCAAFPEATVERKTEGCDGATLRVRGKVFCWFLVDHHADGRVALWLKAGAEAQPMLVGSDQVRFFVPPYVGHRGWVGLRLDTGPIDWQEAAELLEESYRMTAPKKLILELDAAEASS